MCGRVGPREANKVRAGLGATASDANLGTLHVKLSFALNTCTVKSDKLNAHQVVPRGNTAWEIEVMPTPVVDHVVNSPYAIVQALLGHLEPL